MTGQVSGASYPQGGTISLLDHGYVRLIDHMGGDINIVRAARVSYDAAWRAGEDDKGDAKLIKYLWEHNHTTPFEAVTITFEVKAPIFIFRQWHRHRTQSYNELSARYKELPEEYYVPELEVIGKQSQKNKQVRDTNAELSHAEKLALQDGLYVLKTHSQMSFTLYRDLLTKGFPRELARSVLPVNTYSHMFCTMNLLNMFRFCTLRCDAHAQWEIQQYANAMVELARPRYPVAVAAWEKTFNEGRR